MPSVDFLREILKRDRKTFFKDVEYAKKLNLDYSNENSINFQDFTKFGDLKPLIADFTEYSPLHNGHFHCMNQAKSKVSDALFVAVVPGLFERSGRGLPYILPRQVRAEIAIEVGADVVVEGPPMGIMGSGQYSLCLSKMFQALNTDFIPRGYKVDSDFEEILRRISLGHAVVPKPYKIVDLDTGEIVFKGKLAEDNYVITSFSKSLRKIGFDFKDKFIFIPRIEGVSGTLIRQACSLDKLESVSSMLPKETLTILKREIDNDRAPLHELRDEELILDRANNFSFDKLNNLNFFNEKLANQIIEKRDIKEFETISEIEDSIFYGFSTNFKHRVLSILEANVNKDIIHGYIDNYPSQVRVLNYKNERVLNEFENKILSSDEDFVKDIDVK